MERIESVFNFIKDGSALSGAQLGNDLDLIMPNWYALFGSDCCLVVLNDSVE